MMNFLVPLLKVLLLSVAVCSIGFFGTSWMVRVKEPSEGINPFLLKVWLAVGAVGPLVFIALKLHIFRD
ncbi:MAG: hypothetical protein JWM43_2342 [Acidobacteriaceae bacterium]|nr:hypothetical protein [Acidobacteriaceae bacterium]